MRAKQNNTGATFFLGLLITPIYVQHNQSINNETLTKLNQNGRKSLLQKNIVPDGRDCQRTYRKDKNEKC